MTKSIRDLYDPLCKENNFSNENLSKMTDLIGSLSEYSKQNELDNGVKLQMM